MKRKRRSEHHANDVSVQKDRLEDVIEHRRRIRAALELALLDRFRADLEEFNSEAIYTKAFDVLAQMEAEPGGVVTRLVEAALGCQRQTKRRRMSIHGDEGRLVDMFLNEIDKGMYDR